MIDDYSIQLINVVFVNIKSDYGNVCDPGHHAHCVIPSVRSPLLVLAMELPDAISPVLFTQTIDCQLHYTNSAVLRVLYMCPSL